MKICNTKITFSWLVNPSAFAKFAKFICFPPVIIKNSHIIYSSEQKKFPFLFHVTAFKRCIRNRSISTKTI